MSCNILPSKYPTEKVVVTFDFSPSLASGETIASIVSVVVTVSAGVDASPAAILNGTAAIDATTSQMVLQPVQGGLDQINYDIKATVDTSTGQRLVLAANMPVRA